MQTRVVAGRYRLVRELGRGGMGVVWLADDELVGRQVAVKELRPPAMLDDEEREKFVRRALQEARSAARIHDIGAVTLYDVLPATDGDDAVYLIMELIDGPTLADVIQQRGRLPDADVARLGLQLLSVVEAAHGLGIVHRDIKPGNILIAAGPQVKLTDFGIAHTLGDPRMTNSGIMGTQAYLAPELFEAAPISPAADMWSLGATLFASVEGRGPFDRDTTGATLRAILFDNLPVPRCAPGLAAAISGMLQRDPARRFNVTQARESLARAAAGPPAPSAPTSQDSRPTATLPALRPPAAPYPVPPPSLGTPHSPITPTRYPMPPGPPGPSGPGPRHAAPEVPGQGTAAPLPPPVQRPAPPPQPMPRPAASAPPAAVATFSNMPDELARVLLIVGCFVAIPIVVASFILAVAAGVIVLVLAVAYVIIFMVLRSRWCELKLDSRGVSVTGRKAVNLNWDQITGFGPVPAGSKTFLSAFVVGFTGGPPRSIPICPLEPHHFPPAAIQAAILSYRPTVRIEPLQTRFAYPQQPPPYR